MSTRIFAAPRTVVFAAFSDPARLARWWGPQGFTNTFHGFNFHPGGAWRFTMHGPDGVAYAMDHQFTEIVAPERIVVRHIQQGHDFILTMPSPRRATAPNSPGRWVSPIRPRLRKFGPSFSRRTSKISTVSRPTCPPPIRSFVE